MEYANGMWLSIH